MNILKRFIPFGRNKMYYDAIRLYNRYLYTEAIEKFNTILSHKQRANSLHQTLSRFYCGQAHRNLGEIFLVTGDYKNASKEFTTALKFNPNNIQLNKYLGICFGCLDEYEKAYNAFTKVLQQDPTLLSPGSKLAVVFFNLGLWDKAENIFLEVLKKNPDYADIYFLLGIVYQGKGCIPEAIRSFTKALEINSAYTEAQVKLSISKAYIGQFDEALSAILPVMDRFPSHADIHYACGTIYSAKNENRKSIEYFKKAIEINPAYKKARISLGISLLHVGRLEEGLEELEAVYQEDPADKALKTTIHTLKGMSGSKDLDVQNIVSCLKPVSNGKNGAEEKANGVINYLVVSPGFSDMLSILKAMPQNDTFIFEKLIPLLKETISLHPAYCDIHNSLGTFYIKTGQYEKAIESLREARRINPGYIKARINLFNALKENKDLEAAVEAGIELYEKDLPYPDFMCAVGEVYLSMERFEEALKVVEKILEKKPDFAPAHFLLAQIYNKKGDTDKAAETLKKCLD